MKNLKFQLNKETITSLDNAEQQLIKGGIMPTGVADGTDEIANDLWSSRLFCATDIPGDCSKSKSCGATVCFPL